MAGKLERIWKVVFVAFLGYCPAYDWRKTKKNIPRQPASQPGIEPNISRIHFNANSHSA
jgi:hypothetical protein